MNSHGVWKGVSNPFSISPAATRAIERAIEREIDPMVDTLYGLMPETVIVEGSAK